MLQHLTWDSQTHSHSIFQWNREKLMSFENRWGNVITMKIKTGKTNKKVNWNRKTFNHDSNRFAISKLIQ